MQLTFDGVPGHTGMVGLRLADGSLIAPPPETTPPTENPPATAYRAMCSCGWTGTEDLPPTEEGTWAVGSQWGHQHMMPRWTTTPPTWLVNRSDVLRDNLSELAVTWPMQALGILAAIERWQKPVIEQAVRAAREAGASWADIGAALGVTKQSAHARFSTVVGKNPRG